MPSYKSLIVDLLMLMLGSIVGLPYMLMLVALFV